MEKSQIRNLIFSFFDSFGKHYLTVDYDRNGEHNHITFSNLPKWLLNNKTEKFVRKWLNK